MIPKEAANCGDEQKAIDWIRQASARDIEQFIHLCQLQTSGVRNVERGRIALDIRLSEDAEIYSRRIVWLTWVVAVFTAVLVVLTAVLVFLTCHLVENHTQSDQTHHVYYERDFQKHAA